MGIDETMGPSNSTPLIHISHEALVRTWAAGSSDLDCVYYFGMMNSRSSSTLSIEPKPKFSDTVDILQIKSKR
jgi:hypothetical protein